MDKRPSLSLPVLAWAISRLTIVFFMPAISSDAHLYLTYAVQGVDLGQVPYRDFHVEYPPVAYWSVALPRWLDPVPYPSDNLNEEALERLFPRYLLFFRLEMALLDGLAFWFFLG